MSHPNLANSVSNALDALALINRNFMQVDDDMMKVNSNMIEMKHQMDNIQILLDQAQVIIRSQQTQNNSSNSTTNFKDTNSPNKTVIFAPPPPQADQTGQKPLFFSSPSQIKDYAQAQKAQAQNDQKDDLSGLLKPGSGKKVKFTNSASSKPIPGKAAQAPAFVPASSKVNPKPILKKPQSSGSDFASAQKPSLGFPIAQAAAAAGKTSLRKTNRGLW
ncbi:MAG: hypothetical protein WD512_17075 [Candidatus Paceibacterota bacterium]